MSDEAGLEAARGGDREAFSALTRALVEPLRGYALHMVANAADAEDLVQETLLRGFEKIGEFRGESSLETWLFTIATRLCLDHLRGRKRWSVDCRIKARKVGVESPEVMRRMTEIHATPEFRFSVGEHIAYCLACTGRNLEPEHQAALLLREVFGFEHKDAAAIMGLNRSAFRHRHRAARARLEELYEGMCALVNKQGVCYQCKELRDHTDPSRWGDELVQIGRPEQSASERLDARLAIVRRADLVGGKSKELHALFLGLVGEIEGAA